MGGMVNLHLYGSLVCRVLPYILPVDSWQPCEYDSQYFLFYKWGNNKFPRS